MQKAFNGLKTFLLSWLLLVCTSANSQTTLSIDPAQRTYNLAPYIEILEDFDGSLDLTTILASTTSTDWRYNQNRRINLGYSESHYWFRFSVQHARNAPDNWILELDNPLINEIDVFVVNASSISEEFHTGDKMAFVERPIEHRKFLFPISLTDDENLQIYLRVHSDSILNLPLHLIEQNAYITREQSTVLIDGLLNGIMITIFIIALFFAVLMRQKSYIYFSGTIFFIAVTMLSVMGYTFNYLLPESIWWQNQTTQLIAPIGSILFTLFIIEFLSIKKQSPVIYNIYLFMIGLFTLKALSGALVTKAFAMQSSQILNLTNSCLHIIVGCYFCYRGSKPARYFTAGVLFSAGGVLLLLATVSGLVPETAFTRNSLHLGMLGLFLSISTGLIMGMVEERASKERALQQRAQAVAQNKAKSEFLANMSHEIRTPMNAILGFTDLSLKSEINPQSRRYLGKVQFAAKNLLIIINDILDYSKIEAQGISLDVVEFRLQDIISHQADLFSPSLEDKEIDILFYVDKDVPNQLRGDPLRLNQILTNLIGNAIKFTERGEIVVNIKREALSDDDYTLLFSVADTGIGIQADTIPLLFAPFTQAEDSTTRRFGGTGLGLSICKNLVELMDGEFQVTSTPGKGSRFSFSAHFTAIKEASSALPHLPAALRGKRVLCLSASHVLADYLKRNLLLMGALAFDTKLPGEINPSQTDGPASPYDLVIVDANMRGDLEELRALLDASNVLCKRRSVLLTVMGRGTTNDEEDASQKEIILTRPITPYNLIESLLVAFGETTSGFEDYAQYIDHQAHEPPQFDADMLVVEDNTLNQELIVNLLEGSGLRIDIACNGNEALDAVKLKRYDVILMDIQMPVMDGIEATKRIRQQFGPQDLPIIALTASTMKDDVDLCMGCGMNEIVGKPFDPANLFAVLKNSITRRTRESAPSASDDTHTTATATDNAPISPTPVVPTATSTLPGIDYEKAMQFMAQRQDLFDKILGNFATRYATADEDIEALLKEDRYKDAETLVHSLKGLSGMLGATDLERTARDLEDKINQHSQEISIEFSAFRDALSTMHRAASMHQASLGGISSSNSQ